MDAVVASALIAAVGGLIVALIDNYRLRQFNDMTQKEKREAAAVQLRIREIDAVEEFRDALRETVKEQGERIGRLEEELERARLERLQHERERLAWFEKEKLWEREKSDLETRIEHLEELLHVKGIDSGKRRSV